MKKSSTTDMPPEYGYLNAPLNRAQEHVFLINAEIDRLDGNPLFEDKLVKLQDEKMAITRNLKNDFEMQTWEEGPGYVEEIHAIVDTRLGDDAYQSVKDEVEASGKTYDMSDYWGDTLQRNLAVWRESYDIQDGWPDPGNHLDVPDIGDDYEDFDRL